MEKEFIPYEQAVALKELAFDEECIALYKFKKFKYKIKDCNGIVDFYNRDGKIISYLAPTFSQAFEFFREKYGYDVTIKKCTPSDYKFEIEQLFAEGDNHYFIDFVFKSYKEAELKCIDKLIETVKRKQ